MNALAVAPSIRGPLKFSTETSSPQLEAGKRFSVSLRITNPYDVPVEIHRIETKLPAKFISVSLRRGRSFKDRLLAAFAAQTGSRAIAEATISSVNSTSNGDPLIEDVATDPATAVLLQPGNSTVQVFGMAATGWLFFSPTSYSLNIEVSYSIDSKINRDTVSYQMNVRSPLRAIIAGSIVGALIGFFVRATRPGGMLADGKLPLSWPFFLTIVASVLVASMVVVAFARKKDSQPILSIEDFYGGLFVGFISAYGGNVLLDNISHLPNSSLPTK
jgi:hypothetical protein